jgi:ubiquinone/menaquinone biosynthesis C-methylase UbiE
MNSITPQQLSAAAHATLSHANPLSVEQMNRLVALALNSRPRSAIEIGCGPGTFALALAEHTDLDITAIDINPYFLDRARLVASQKVLIGSVIFELCSASEYEGPEVDLVVCIGSSQALGTPREAISRAGRLLRAGGTLVFAELIWSSPPPDNILEFLGTTADHYWSTETAASVFTQANYNLTEQFHASHASWLEYEHAIFAGRLALAETLPPEQSQSVRSRAELWFQLFMEHGQHCLGFAAYVATHRGC